MTPPVRPYDRSGLHRLIPSLYSEAGTVLADVADSDAMIQDLVLLDGATNDRVQGEQYGLMGISTYELLYGVPNAHIVNAAFTHSSQYGSRFNDSTRGAWYAAEELETSIVEVSYHKARRLAEIVVPELPGMRPDEATSTYDDWLADFRAEFHVLEPAAQFSAYLKPEPVPQCYAEPQRLARQLLEQQSNGLLYRSVRRRGNKCLVCFRPALVYKPRRGERVEITFTSRDAGYEHRVRKISAAPHAGRSLKRRPGV